MRCSLTALDIVLTDLRRKHNPLGSMLALGLHRSRVPLRRQHDGLRSRTDSDGRDYVGAERVGARQSPVRGLSSVVQHDMHDVTLYKSMRTRSAFHPLMHERDDQHAERRHARRHPPCSLVASVRRN